ncbi:tRNA(Arg) A34 adenosine deaminase TadA [Singulisphaera sp. GP187]|uniref:hypothetical protein n=1 Tax=Singulisphaera sp. GP187 TaxID=1882752 RepID=UPI00092BF823|nr:hypothetical protein [Singulisphaera sp. GP187]SIN78049.1 tRNA(Arg) A34 adenosine deaminase TadA [Singulisphaera sp. GP187]
MSSLFQIERDCIATLGLLTSNYIRFDPEVRKGAVVTHVRGYNVHTLVVDNIDGEVLSLEQNRIHQDENPLQHGEQVAIRSAIERVKAKRPRQVGVAVEAYYKSSMFMAAGSTPEDFLNSGCTLYNTFDPCGMCAVTLLACYMKRIAYVFADKKHSAVYDAMREYFKGRESIKEPVALSEKSDEASFVARASKLIRDLQVRVTALEEAGTPLVQTLDACYEPLKAAAQLLIGTSVDDLASAGVDRDRNAKTLLDIKRRCNSL